MYISLRQRLKSSIRINWLKYFNYSKKIPQFVGDALVTGTKFKLSLLGYFINRDYFLDEILNKNAKFSNVI